MLNHWQDKYFLNIAHTNSKYRKQLIDILNPKMISTLETDEVFGVQLLGALKNVFAFIYGILEGYGISQEIICGYQVFIIFYVQNLLNKLNININEFINFPAGMQDFLLTCQKGRNGAGGRLVGKKLHQIEDKLPSQKELKKDISKQIELKNYIEKAINEFGKTVEGFQSVSGLYNLLKGKGLTDKDLILIKKLNNLIEGKFKFETIFTFILEQIKL